MSSRRRSTRREPHHRSSSARSRTPRSRASRSCPVATDTTPPAAPVITAPANNSYDTDGAFTVSGTAEAASTVNLLEGTTNRGTATTTAGGAWSIPLTGVADGVHTYTATATDAATNVSQPSAGRTITVDTVRPLVSSTVPTAGASSIAVGANVTATFSEPMTAASLTTTSFSLAPTGWLGRGRQRDLQRRHPGRHAQSDRRPGRRGVVHRDDHDGRHRPRRQHPPGCPHLDVHDGDHHRHDAARGTGHHRAGQQQLRHRRRVHRLRHGRGGQHREPARGHDQPGHRHDHGRWRLEHPVDRRRRRRPHLHRDRHRRGDQRLAAVGRADDHGRHDPTARLEHRAHRRGERRSPSAPTSRPPSPSR